MGGSGVPLKEGAVGETLGAETALEALGSMGAHVNVEGALLGEAFAADAALEGADARVGHHVLQQVVAEGEGAPADGTLVGLLTYGETAGGSAGINTGVLLSPGMESIFLLVGFRTRTASLTRRGFGSCRAVLTLSRGPRGPTQRRG